MSTEPSKPVSRCRRYPPWLLLGVMVCAQAADGLHGAAPADDEALLVNALQQVRGERLDEALDSIQTLVHKNPKFRLAQLVYGDLLLAKAGNIAALGNVRQAGSEQVDDLRAEARSRFNHQYAHPPAGSVPAYLLELAGSHANSIVVDIEQSRLYLFENRDGHPHLIADYYASSGKNGALKQKEGDRRTPVGVYFVSGHIEDAALPDFYGAGAFPIDYPNPWDRRQGRTGHGIWLHGVPKDTYSRPPRASDGCVTLSNEDFEALTPYIRTGATPVVIARKVNWVDAGVQAGRRAELGQALEAWRGDWESRDLARYGAHYSQAFRSGVRDRDAWLGHKARVNARKSYIRVGIADLGVFSDPSDPALVVVVFEQDYRSNNYRNVARKRQYWRREADGVWRILYEGPA